MRGIKILVIFLIAVMATTVVSTAGAVTAAPFTMPLLTPHLPTPRLVAPSTGARLPAQPLDVVLQWQPVTSRLLQVQGYKLEWQWYNPAYGSWFPLYWEYGGGVWKPYLIIPAQFSSFHFGSDDFPSRTQWQWRVTALSTKSGYDSAPSSWHSFTFGKPPIGLPTPLVWSPPNYSIVNAGTPLTYDLKPVPGALTYIIWQEKLVDGVWQPDNPIILNRTDMGTQLPWTSNHYTNTVGTFRWHVVATNSDLKSVPATLYSEPSPWRMLVVVES